MPIVEYRPLPEQRELAPATHDRPPNRVHHTRINGRLIRVQTPRPAFGL